MAFDVYSPCPAFTGNKIKFCCSDSAQDLIKLNKMMEGQQHKACAAEAERLLAKKPGKACLLAYQVQALFAQKDQQEAFRKKAKEFAEAFPQNSMAQSAAAVAELYEGRISDGIDRLQTALQFAPEGPLPWMVALAAEMCVRSLLQMNLPLAALGHAQLLVSIYGSESRAAQLVGQVLEECHLLMREDEPFAAVSAEVPWAEDYEIAVEHAELGMFKLAAIGLTQLGESNRDGFEIWRSLGFCWGYLGDNQKAAIAFHVAAQVAKDANKAAEAESLAQMLEPLDDADRIQLVRESRNVKDAGRLLEKLASLKHIVSEPVEPESWLQQNMTPPEAHYLVLDRPRPRSPENMTLDEMPFLFGSLTLWGKRTDRPAKLELTYTELPEPSKAIEELLKTLGDEVSSEDVERKTQDNFQKEHQLLRPPMWTPPNMNPQLSHKLSVELTLRQVHKAWVDAPLGYLENRSPRQVATESPLKVSAALLRLELSDLFEDPLALNPLRAELGLPALELIRVPEDATELPGMSLPELQRLDVAAASQSILVQAATRGMGTHCDVFSSRALQALADKIPSEEISQRLEVYRRLISVTRDTDRCLDYLSKARAITPSDNWQLQALWEVTELRLRLMRNEGEQAERILKNYNPKFGRHPEAMQMMHATLVSLGVIRADGTPTQAANRPAPKPSAPPAAASSPPSGLWTPGNEASSSAEKKTLWTPGMD